MSVLLVHTECQLQVFRQLKRHLILKEKKKLLVSIFIQSVCAGLFK